MLKGKVEEIPNSGVQSVGRQSERITRIRGCKVGERLSVSGAMLSDRLHFPHFTYFITSLTILLYICEGLKKLLLNC